MTRTMDPRAGVYEPDADYNQGAPALIPMAAGAPKPGTLSHPEGQVRTSMYAEEPTAGLVGGVETQRASAATLAPLAAALVPDGVAPLDEPRERTVGVTTEPDEQTLATRDPQAAAAEAYGAPVDEPRRVGARGRARQRSE